LEDKYSTKAVLLYFMHIGIKKMILNDLVYDFQVADLLIFKINDFLSVNSKEAGNGLCANFVQKKRVTRFVLVTL